MIVLFAIVIGFFFIKNKQYQNAFVEILKLSQTKGLKKAKIEKFVKTII